MYGKPLWKVCINIPTPMPAKVPMADKNRFFGNRQGLDNALFTSLEKDNVMFATN